MFDKLMAARQQMENLKKELDLVTAEGIAEGGLVKVICSGNKEILEVKISSELQGDTEALEDLVRVAVNKALAEAGRQAEIHSARLAATLLPGLNI